MEAVKVGNMDIVRRLVDAGNARDMDAASQFVAPTLTSHTLYDAVDPVTGEPLGYETEFKQEDMVKYDAHEREMFPEQHTTLDEIFEVGDDKVLSIATTVSTHKSGKQVTTKSVSIDRIADGKIVETWNLWDRLGYWQQLGIVPRTPELLAKLQNL